MRAFFARLKKKYLTWEKWSGETENGVDLLLRPGNSVRCLVSYAM